MGCAQPVQPAQSHACDLAAPEQSMFIGHPLDRGHFIPEEAPEAPALESLVERAYRLVDGWPGSRGKS